MLIAVGLDLPKLLLTGLDVDMGVSKTSITLPSHGRPRARINGGVSSLTVLVPRGMAARLQVERGLGSVDVIGDYQRNGYSYVSPGYERAQDRVDLSIKAGTSRITVQDKMGDTILVPVSGSLCPRRRKAKLVWCPHLSLDQGEQRLG